MVSSFGGLPLSSDNAPKPLPSKRLLFIGTCQVAPLQNKAFYAGMVADHILCESYSHCEVPAIDGEYDAVVIGLTLRHIHLEAAHRFDGTRPFGNCFIWPRLVAEGREQEYFDICSDLIRSHVDRLCTGLPGTKFFMSFIEPRHNYLGNLLKRYHLSNPAYFAQRLNEALAEALEAHTGAYFFDMNEIISLGGNLRAQDDYINNAGHGALLLYPEDAAPRIQPSTPANALWESVPAVDAVADLFLRRLIDNLEIIEQPLRTKAIVVDLDDTLWSGIAAEEDKELWEFTEGWPLGMAEALLIYKARGGMLAICSKNDETVIRRRFDEIWKGRIRLDDFASVRINYERKSENIRSILADLNILPESVLFVDDNPREIDEVAQAFPDMQFLSAEHFDWRRRILMSPTTQVPVITEDAARRTQSIQTKAARAQPQSVSRQEWLDGLGLRLEVAHVTHTGHARFERAFELLNKTNQFNTTGRRWTREEVAALFASGGRLICGMLSDRVTDHGMVGIVVTSGNEMVQAVLSCRAFGNNAEHALAKIAIDEILERHQQVTGSIIDTGRNKTCHRFFVELGFKDLGGGAFVGHASPPAVPHITTTEPLRAAS